MQPGALRYRKVELPVLTERLCLRAYRHDDLESLFRLRSNPDVVELLYGDPLTEAEAPALLDRYMSVSRFDADGDELMLAVERRKDGAFLGNLKLQIVSVKYQQGEIGFVFDPHFHGKGYAREAATAALDLGFRHFGMHRIRAHCDVRNTASWRLMQKLGMKREAHFRESEFFKGVWADDFVYAILAREWLGAQGAE